MLGLAKSEAGGTTCKGGTAMLEKILFIAAAVATVLGFVLDLVKEGKALSDDEGKKKGR